MIHDSILPSFKFENDDLKIIELLRKTISTNVDTANENKMIFVGYKDYKLAEG